MTFNTYLLYTKKKRSKFILLPLDEELKASLDSTSQKNCIRLSPKEKNKEGTKQHLLTKSIKLSHLESK